MNKYRQFLTEKKTEQDLLVRQSAEFATEVTKCGAEAIEIKEAREVVNNVHLATQISVSEFIEEVVGLALQTVFDESGDVYGFKVEYEIKRNKSEAKLYIMKNGRRVTPDGGCGGGVLDVASFGLRAVNFALASPPPEPVLLLDEPGRFMGDYALNFGRMLKEVSDLLELQIIMISHDSSLIECADKSFRVTQSKGISKVEEV